MENRIVRTHRDLWSWWIDHGVPRNEMDRELFIHPDLGSRNHNRPSSKSDLSLLIDLGSLKWQIVSGRILEYQWHTKMWKCAESLFSVSQSDPQLLTRFLHTQEMERPRHRYFRDCWIWFNVNTLSSVDTNVNQLKNGNLVCESVW